MKFTRLLICLTLALLFACSSEDPESGDEPQRTVIAFKDISASLPKPAKYGDYGALWGDFNGDGLLDLIYMGHGKGPLLLEQDSSGGFIDVTANSGIRNSNWKYTQQNDRHGGSCADFNNDGIADLFIGHGAKKGETLGIKYDELLRGNGDYTFTTVTQESGALNQYGRGRMGSWVDYDNDGWLDLYISNFRSANVMLKNNRDGTFSDVTDDTGLGYLGVRAAWADYDGDGHVDVLLGSPLKLYRNNGEGAFVDTSQALVGNRKVFAFSFSWGDIDNDGDLDVIVGRLNNESHLYINNDGEFSRLSVAALELQSNEMITGVAMADIDNDADLDIIRAGTHGHSVYLNQGKFRFQLLQIQGRETNPEDMYNGDLAVADFNRDGLVDIATDDLASYMLFENMSSVSNHWLQLRFRGETNNAMGFGARVWVSAGGELLAYRQYSGSPAAMKSSGCSPLHIGLGQHQSVDVRILWLNGEETRLIGVDVDQIIDVSEKGIVR